MLLVTCFLFFLESERDCRKRRSDAKVHSCWPQAMLVGKVGNNGQGQVLRKERKPSFEIQLPRGKDGGGGQTELQPWAGTSLTKVRSFRIWHSSTQDELALVTNKKMAPPPLDELFFCAIWNFCPKILTLEPDVGLKFFKKVK